jgi:SdrD B-like domain
MQLLRQLFGRQQAAPKRRPVGSRPGLEALEARDVPTLTAISSTFNGTAIPAGSSVWFNSVGKVSGVKDDAAATIRLTDATITSGKFTVDVPDAVITITPDVTTATTTYNTQTDTWETTIPSSGFSGNVFLAGATLAAPDGLPGGIKPVVWQADFTTDTPGVNINWKWAAAVYTRFSTDYNALGVKPIDGSAANPYANSHHAGTPENFNDFVFGGARGGGGSNFTGSYSGTKSVTPSPLVLPQLSSIAGSVYLDDGNGVRDDGEPGIGGVQITLTGIDDQNNAVTLVVFTDDDGRYSFTNLRPGTYQVSESQPEFYDDGEETVGKVNGTERGQKLDNDLIGDIVLAGGEDGVAYDFGELFAGS